VFIGVPYLEYGCLSVGVPCIYTITYIHFGTLSLSLSRSGVGKIVALAWLEYGCRLSKGIELDRSRHLVCVCVCVCVC